MWQLDCETYRRALLPFELCEVTEPEHLEFVRSFAESHGLGSRLMGPAAPIYEMPHRSSAGGFLFAEDSSTAAMDFFDPVEAETIGCGFRKDGFE